MHGFLWDASRGVAQNRNGMIADPGPARCAYPKHCQTLSKRAACSISACNARDACRDDSVVARQLHTANRMLLNSEKHPQYCDRLAQVCAELHRLGRASW